MIRRRKGKGPEIPLKATIVVKEGQGGEEIVRKLTAALKNEPHPPSVQDLIGAGFYVVLSRLEWLEIRLAQINRKLDSLTSLERQEMADLTQITADVSANGDAVASAVQLLTQLHDEIVAAGTDPAALAALASSLEANTQALADAVVANTPSA